MKKQDRKLLDDIFLQPWFLPRDLALAIRHMLPPEYRHRMRFFFDDNGCMRCGTTTAAYGSNGFCKPCAQEVKLKLFFTVKRRWTAASPENLPRTFTRIADAQRLLKDLISTSLRPRSLPTRRKRH